MGLTSRRVEYVYTVHNSSREFLYMYILFVNFPKKFLAVYMLEYARNCYERSRLNRSGTLLAFQVELAQRRFRKKIFVKFECSKQIAFHFFARFSRKYNYIFAKRGFKKTYFRAISTSKHT